MEHRIKCSCGYETGSYADFDEHIRLNKSHDMETIDFMTTEILIQSEKPKKTYYQLYDAGFESAEIIGNNTVLLDLSILNGVESVEINRNDVVTCDEPDN